eukprot:6205993-Pleurochrysis_carterae.AAC.1
MVTQQIGPASERERVQGIYNACKQRECARGLARRLRASSMSSRSNLGVSSGMPFSSSVRFMSRTRAT